MSEYKHLLEALERVSQRVEELSLSKHKKFLTIDEASAYTGIPKATLYGYTSRSIISYHKI